MQISPISFPGLSLFPHLDLKEFYQKPGEQGEKNVHGTPVEPVAIGQDVGSSSASKHQAKQNQGQEQADCDEVEGKVTTHFEVKKEVAVVHAFKQNAKSPKIQIQETGRQRSLSNDAEKEGKVTTVTTVSTTTVNKTVTSPIPLNDKQIQQAFKELQTFTTLSPAMALPGKAKEVLSSLSNLDFPKISLPSLQSSLHQGLSVLPPPLQEFVHQRQLFEEYDRTYQDCKRRADMHKRQDPQSMYTLMLSLKSLFTLLILSYLLL